MKNRRDDAAALERDNRIAPLALVPATGSKLMPAGTFTVAPEVFKLPAPLLSRWANVIVLVVKFAQYTVFTAIAGAAATAEIAAMAVKAKIKRRGSSRLVSPIAARQRHHVCPDAETSSRLPAWAVFVFVAQRRK